MIEDAELLRRYVAEKSEAAFTELVRRRVDLVYSVAVRQVGGDAHLAQDVTQKVFADLARKAATLLDRPVLSGWLYRSAQFAASDVVRSERRRRAREQETGIMQELTTNGEPVTDWDRLRPLLDLAMSELKDPDRDAIALRFFEGRAFAEIGRTLRLTEEAARKRVDRALDKLAGILSRRGVTSTAAAVGVALTQQTAFAAPAGLAASVAGSAIAGAAAAGGVGAGVGLFALLSSAKVTLGAAAVAALAVGGAVYERGVARQHEMAAAASVREERALFGKIDALEKRAAAAEARAKAAEADNLKLLEAIASATAARKSTGKAPVSTEVQTAEATGPVTQQMVETRYKRGQDLARSGNWEDALKEFLWCYDEGMIRVGSYAGVRGSFLLSEIAKLAKTFPAARVALQERRDRSQALALSGPAERGAARDFGDLNRALGESARTLELYDRLPAGDPRRAGLATLDVQQLLLEAQRYNDVVRELPYEQMLRMFDSGRQPIDASKFRDPKSVEDSRRKFAVESAAKNLEALAGAGDLAHTREFAQRILAYDHSPEARTVLQKHLTRAGQPNLLAGLPGP